MADSAGAQSRVPTPPCEAGEEVNRAMVVAEAKLLVRQLDAYVELFGQWIEEGLDDHAE